MIAIEREENTLEERRPTSTEEERAFEIYPNNEECRLAFIRGCQFEKNNQSVNDVIDGEVTQSYIGGFQLNVHGKIPHKSEKKYKFGEKVKLLIVKKHE